MSLMFKAKESDGRHDPYHYDFVLSDMCVAEKPGLPTGVPVCIKFNHKVIATN